MFIRPYPKTQLTLSLPFRYSFLLSCIRLMVQLDIYMLQLSGRIDLFVEAQIENEVHLDLWGW